MSRNAELFLDDILEAIDAIEEYVASGEEAFIADGKTRDAAQMRLIQIGEAIKKVEESGLKLSELEPGIEWSKIAGMRDVIAHHYWLVSKSLLWDTVQKFLPRLKAATKRLHKKRMPESPSPIPRSAKKNE